jgi:hypothetical protein
VARLIVALNRRRRSGWKRHCSRRGFTGCATLFDPAPRSYADAFFPRDLNGDALLGFGQTFRIVDPGYAIKIFPASARIVGCGTDHRGGVSRQGARLPGDVSPSRRRHFPHRAPRCDRQPGPGWRARVAASGEHGRGSRPPLIEDDVVASGAPPIDPRDAVVDADYHAGNDNAKRSNRRLPWIAVLTAARHRAHPCVTETSTAPSHAELVR